MLQSACTNDKHRAVASFKHVMLWDLLISHILNPDSESYVADAGDAAFSFW